MAVGKVVCGILGNITSLLLFSAPIPTFLKIFKDKDVGSYSGIPYVATLLNCMMWVLYGLPVIKLQVLVVTINVAGFVLELIYIVMYFVYANKKMRMKVTQALAAVVVAFLLMAVLTLKLVNDHKKRKDIIGSLCVVFAVIMYISPLTVMKMVIQTRSVKYMPFTLSFFMFINGVVWFIYAFLGGIDIYIIIPNGGGAVAAAAQLALYAFYRNAIPREDIDDKGNPMKPDPISI